MAGNTRTRETRAQRVHRAATQPGGLQWPELRVGREIDLPRDIERTTDDFQNEFGRLNRRIGIAYAAGLLSCHYLSDGELRSMIFEKYRGSSGSLDKSLEIYRNIGKSINMFIREQAQYAQDSYNQQFLYERRYDERRIAAHQLPPAEYWTPADARLPQGTSAAIEAFGNSKLAFDLSSNDFLRQERSEIITYLRREERLATRLVDPDWRPHVTFFEMRPHLTNDDVLPRVPTAALPEFIPLQAPKAEGSVY